MRKSTVSLLLCASLSMGGCFLVGYDGLQGTPDTVDSGELPNIMLTDASSPSDGDGGGDGDGDGDGDDDDDMDASTDASGTELDGSVDAETDWDAAFDAGDSGPIVDASEPDSGDLDASLDASSDDAGDGPEEDSGSTTPDAGVDSGDPLPDAGEDAGQPLPDAGPPPRDAGPLPDPMPYCGPNEQCTLGCGGDVPVCTPNCDSNTRCDIDCDGADHCKPTCNKSLNNICEIDCTGTDRCDATCKGGGDCKIDCRQNGTCNKVRCEGSVLNITQCMIVCEANDPSCGFEHCWGDALGFISIGGLGVTVKQQTCNGYNGRKVVLCGGTYGFSDINPYLPCQAN